MDKTVTKRWKNDSLTITVDQGNVRWQFVACYGKETDTWCTFGYITIGEDPEDNLDEYRKDGLNDDEVGEMVSAFEKEYCNGGIAR